MCNLRKKTFTLASLAPLIMISPTEDLEEQAFATKVVYQSRLECRIECNTPPIIVIHIEMRTKISVNVLQTNEFRVRQSQQNVLLLREQIWSKFNQGEGQKPKLMTNCYSF